MKYLQQFLHCQFAAQFRLSIYIQRPNRIICFVKVLASAGNT